MPSDIKDLFIDFNLGAHICGIIHVISVVTSAALNIDDMHSLLEDFSRPLTIVAVCVCIISLSLFGCFGVLRNNIVMITVYACLMMGLLVASVLVRIPNCTQTKANGVTLAPGFMLYAVSLLQFCALAAFKLRED